MVATEPLPWSRTGRVNRLALVSLVCGIVTFCGLFPIAIAAVVLGHVARRAIRRTGERGGRLAVTGLVLGYIGTALTLVTAVSIVRVLVS
jgi:threonine/homoserine/homoserine lactone efflux protein